MVVPAAASAASLFFKSTFAATAWPPFVTSTSTSTAVGEIASASAAPRGPSAAKSATTTATRRTGLRWGEFTRGTLAKLLGATARRSIGSIGGMDLPGTETDVITPVVLVAPDFKPDLHALAGTVFVQKGHLVLHELHFDVLGIAVVPGGDDKLALGEAAAKCHDIHNDLDGPFNFVAHCN
ncbi:MAG: hypothetical protein JWM59_5072 [Verrucomicrobiales bacterium]|nr:hypothetical protein [Verrucomicrobiales bacterium]